jgi:hypothetical protein
VRRFALLRSVVAVAALLCVPALPVTAKDDPKTKEKEAPAGPHLRWAHSFGDAMAEARERGCVVFATFHEDG